MTTTLKEQDDFLFNDFQKQIDEVVNGFIHTIPNELFKYVKSKILETKQFLRKVHFNLNLLLTQT